MSKNKLKQKKIPSAQVYAENERAMRELHNMKHRDLQRACIVRGMSSEDMVKADHHKLVSWFCKNYENGQDEARLLDHDVWVEEQLQIKGYKKGDVMLSPALRFSYVKDFEKIEKPKSPKPEKVIESPVIKTRAVMDEKTGVRSGTKKAMTFDMTLEGKTLEKIIESVKKAFPGAEEKSIKIWHKKALKLQKS